MRIYTHHTETMIRDLAAIIHKDPVSMEHWKCLHVSLHEFLPDTLSPETLQAAADAIRQAHKHCDCDVLFAKDYDFFIISKTMLRDDMETLASHIMDQLGVCQVDQMQWYDLFYDWRDIWDLLHGKISDAALPESPVLVRTKSQKPPVPLTFGDIGALQEIFEEVRAKRPSRNPMYVMLVEDDKITRRLVSNVFKQDFAVITAENAEEAITNYLLYAPDIVFLDIGLPDANGFEVLKQLLACDEDAYVIMFSGNSYLDNLLHALTNGASGFVSKPFKQDKLQHYIHDYAQRRHKHGMHG